MPKIGLIIGRFQPFHKGHLYVIQEALKRVDYLKIAIGSSNVTNEDNPYTYHKRKNMIDKFIKHEKLQDKIIKVIPSPDIPDDREWTQDLIQKTGNFDVVFGNNTWTNDCLKKEGYKIVEIPYLNRPEYQGKVIRKKIKKGKDWQKDIPFYLSDSVKKCSISSSE